MVVKTMVTRIKKEGGGYAFYVTKADAEELNLTVGDKYIFLFSDKDHSKGIITKELNFNPSEALNALNPSVIVAAKVAGSLETKNKKFGPVEI